MAIEYVRLSQQGKDQLSRLKRHTGIDNWNVLCRWAFCLSLSEPSAPQPVQIPSDSNVEMSWKVFAGRSHEIYLALLKQRCVRDGLATDKEGLNLQFRLHLHRGIAYLAGNRDIRNIKDLVELPLSRTALQ